MPTTSEYTLKSFFTADVSKPITSGGDFKDAFDTIRKSAGALPAAAAGGLDGAFNGAVEEVFSIKLSDVLLNSWSRIAALTEAMRATQADPEAVMVVPLLDHKVTTKHTPKVDLLYGPKSLASLVFDLAVAMDLKGVQLELQGGRITALRGGVCSGQGTIALAGKTLIQRNTPAFDLPGRLTFGG